MSQRNARSAKDFSGLWAASDPRAAHSLSSYRYLLDLDDDLAQEFDLRMRVVARQIATVVVVDVAVGTQDTSAWLAAPREWVRSAGDRRRVCDRYAASAIGVTTELVGAGDLLQRWEPGPDDILERSCEWRALVPCRLAVLDENFAERVRPWPQIGNALLRRAARRAGDLNLLGAIACHPRLESG